MIVARVNASVKARNAKMAILLTFTLVTNKAEDWIFWLLARPSHRIGPGDNNNSLLETGNDKRLIS